jgi:hypothetical protein
VAPEVEARVAVIVLGAGGEPLPAATRATLQVSMERALEADRRLEVVDQDIELARRGGAVPAEKVSEARGLRIAGEELLRRGKTAEAIAKLEAASAHLADVLAWASKRELADAQFFLGAARAIAGEDKAALADFVALLAWRPDYVADPSVEPDAVIPLWEKAQAKVAKLPGGSIEIDSRPDGAMAYVDGRFVGFTPTVVEALPAAVHYVTIRMHGRIRSVTAVKVSSKEGAELAVKLAPTPGIDELEQAIHDLSAGVGAAQAPAAAQAGLAELGELIGAQHAVVLVAPERDEPYVGYVYAVDGGTQLARAEVALGERDPEEAFAELAAALYAQISFEPVEEPPPPVTVVERSRKPFYKKWWFWGAVGAAVTAGVAIPLLLRDDAPELGCPSGDSCGIVVLSF